VKGLPRAVRDSALVALYDWLWIAQDQGVSVRLWRVVSRADDDPWRRRFREVVRKKAADLLADDLREPHAIPAVNCAMLAKYLTAAGKKKEAAAVLRGARLAHPDDFWIHYVLGSHLVEAADYEPRRAELREAVGCFRAALAVRPDVSPAWTWLGSLLTLQGDLEEATAAFRKAVEFDPDLSDAYVNLGGAFLRQNKPEEAAAAYRRALELDPRNHGAYTGLGGVLEARGDREGAFSIYRKALEVDARDPLIHWSLGQLQLRDGRFAEAKASVKRCLDLVSSTCARKPYSSARGGPTGAARSVIAHWGDHAEPPCS
jgi:Flp pilus assembly protein TadD